jgi:hypothetical protein
LFRFQFSIVLFILSAFATPRHISAALLPGGAPLLSGFLWIVLLLWILLLLVLRLLTAVLTTARIVFMGALSLLRALLRIGHLKPPGIFIPLST